MTTPPRPRHAPTVGQPQAPTSPKKVVNSQKNGGGFNLAPTVSLNVNAGNNNGTPTNGNTAGQAHNTKKGVPGSDFMSNEDIRAYCEHVRKEARNRATERAMDADHLEAVLRTIPDQAGSMSGSRARARRVSRQAKKIAAAEKAIQKYAALLYGTFEREYESDLRKVGKGRTQQNHRRPFSFG
uniref:PCQ3_29 n=1 Tax=Streptomyces sp. W9 TaxID=682410 RepID=D0UZ78_9ACTN|nr:plasmid transfer protein TraA [Streptomyces sp. W9]ACX85530.1 pCQ3_29 [Streptomyces sp. W9]